MSDSYYLTRPEIAQFLPDVRAQRRFDLMQRKVSETEDTLSSNVGTTATLKEATFLTLSANAELPSERVFRWSRGLSLTVDDNFATLSLTADVPRTSGGHKVTFVCEGDSAVAVPLTGRLATTDNVENLANKTLVTPLLAGLGDYADDAAAQAEGVPVGGMYRDGSTLKIRAA